ncbi:FAD-dependent oxidoreductase [Halobacterium jilantaiense]|uniref:Glycerol-3-phosphate dehydrogenase n=1 Tax=Halobacterium jilantaiense TaxID=355548 RepID=A0A1I0MS51_9EURY|nr:FAD-dependent oxidoreductase [Halobacterium jilantaiense]SEV91494.1 glycerol-3-phosphate dehydrogenase [Halobacterium jilantaiense]
MTEHTSVLVVGGGATGTGVARDLALRGVDVTLVDRGGLGSGTTGRSHGLLHSGARYADTSPEDARECVRENETLRAVAGACIRDTGGFFVQFADDDPDYFDEKVSACEDAGVPVSVADGETAREREPTLAADAERVAAVPDGVVYPSRLVAATAADAREHGATVRTHTPVDSLTTDGDRVTGARLADGTALEADHAVNAAGAWAGDLAATAGVDVDMHPAKGAMVTVDAPGVDTVLNRCRPASDGDIVVPHADTAVLGTTSVDIDSPDDATATPVEVETVVDECSALLPGAADARVVRTYSGVRPLYSPSDYGEDARGISRGFYVLDHADRDGVAGLTTVVGGKLTTYRLMAEATADLVAERLGVDAPCQTDDQPLVAHDDPERLDGLVAEFDADHPADADLR